MPSLPFAAMAPEIKESETYEIIHRACERWLAENPGKNLTHYAAAAGVPYTGGLMRWRSGQVPRGDYLLRLLEEAGMVSDQEDTMPLDLRRARRAAERLAGEAVELASLLGAGTERETNG